MSFSSALSGLCYLSNSLFVDTVLQGTLTIEKSQDGVWWCIGNNLKFDSVSDVLIHCGPFTRLRLFDFDTEEETVLAQECSQAFGNISKNTYGATWNINRQTVYNYLLEQNLISSNAKLE